MRTVYSARYGVEKHRNPTDSAAGYHKNFYVVTWWRHLETGKSALALPYSVSRRCFRHLALH